MWALPKSKARVVGGGQVPIPLGIALPAVVMEGKTPARPTLPARVEDRHRHPVVKEKPLTLPKAGLGANVAGKAETRLGRGLGRNGRRWVPGDQISGLRLPVSPCACRPHPTAQLKSFTRPFGSLPLWGPSQAQ